MRKYTYAAIAILALFVAPHTQATDLTWVSGNWDQSSLNWKDPLNNTVAFTNGDNVTFTGNSTVLLNEDNMVVGSLQNTAGLTIQPYLNNLTIGNVTSTGQFWVGGSTGSVTITGNTINSAGIYLTAGVVLTFGPDSTLTQTGGRLFVRPASTLNIEGIATLSGNTQIQTYFNAGTATINVASGAVVTHNGTDGMIIGQNVANHTGILNVAGSFTQNSNGALFGNQASNVNGILNILNGGVVTFGAGMNTSSTSGANNATGVVLGRNGGTSRGTFNLESGGLLQSTKNIIRGTGQGYFNFNGGTLRALASDGPNGSFLDVTTTTVNSAGAIVDSNGFNISIADGLEAGSGTGGLKKLGSGTLALLGSSTYAGTTEISAGTLAIGGSGTLGAGTYSANITNNGTLFYNSTSDQTLSGVISGSGSLLKSAPSSLTVTGSNTFTGGVEVTGGYLYVSSLAPTGTAQPLGAGSSAVKLGNGTGLIITGSGSTNRGLELANGDIALGVLSGETATISGTISGGGANATLRIGGGGTFNQAGIGSWNSNLVIGGNSDATIYNVTSNGRIHGVGIVEISGATVGLSPRDGSIMNISTDHFVRAERIDITYGGDLNLEAGTLRTNGITIDNNQSSFEWGAATLTMKDPASGNSGSTDRTGSPGGAASGPTVYEGTKITINNLGAKEVATSNGSILDLGGLYHSGGLRYDMLQVTGTLNLSAGNDTLNINYNPYFLRPSGPNDVAAGDWGTLILVHAETISGQFNTITGISSDAIGWSEYIGAFTSAANLPINTYYIEYKTGYGPMAGGDVILFHYRVAGSVPEPASAGMIIAGAMVLRAIARRKKSMAKT